MTLPIHSCFCVVVCESGSDDFGHEFTVHLDALSPSGRSLAASPLSKFVLRSPAVYLVFPAQLPVEEIEGRYVYTIRLGGGPRARHGRSEDESVVLPLDVHLPPE